MAADIDVYLFALMEGDIDEEEYLLLIEEFDNASMKQSRFPYEEYDPFDWNALDELVCKTEFRFEKMTSLAYFMYCKYLQLFQSNDVMRVLA